MKCPICKKEFEDAKYRPFCSRRCADVDLGNWFSEKYTIPAVDLDDQEKEQLIEAIESQMDEQ